MNQKGEKELNDFRKTQLLRLWNSSAQRTHIWLELTIFKLRRKSRRKLSESLTVAAVCGSTSSVVGSSSDASFLDQSAIIVGRCASHTLRLLLFYGRFRSLLPGFYGIVPEPSDRHMTRSLIFSKRSAITAQTLRFENVKSGLMVISRVHSALVCSDVATQLPSMKTDDPHCRSSRTR